MDTNFIVILMSGRNPITSALVPSFVFVVVIALVLGPAINFVTDVSGLVEQGLILVILSVVVGVLLQYLNRFLYKFLEGYGFLSRFPFLIKRKVKQAEKLLCEREKLARQIMKLEKKRYNEKDRVQLSILKDKYYLISTQYDQMYPLNLQSILPTSFGNILRAAEDYARTRYGIDSVTFWRMLVGVMPKEYKDNISQARSEVTFFVNCIILSIFSSVMFGIVAINNGSYIYLLGVLLSLYLGTLFYKASTSSVLSFGEMVRGAYDLYRLDVLAKINIPIPSNSRDEFYTWRNLGEFVQLGASSLDFARLDYKQSDESKDSEGFSILISLLFALLSFILGILLRLSSSQSNNKK